MKRTENKDLHGCWVTSGWFGRSDLFVSHGRIMWLRFEFVSDLFIATGSLSSRDGMLPKHRVIVAVIGYLVSVIFIMERYHIRNASPFSLPLSLLNTWITAWIDRHFNSRCSQFYKTQVNSISFTDTECSNQTLGLHKFLLRRVHIYNKILS